jgi:hypothetical protein
MFRIEVKKPKRPIAEGGWGRPEARGLDRLFRTTAATDRMFEILDYFSKQSNNEDPVGASNAHLYLCGSRTVKVRPYLRVEYTTDFKDHTNPENVKKLEIPLDDIWQVGIPTAEEVRWKFEKIKTP